MLNSLSISVFIVELRLKKSTGIHLVAAYILLCRIHNVLFWKFPCILNLAWEPTEHL